MGGLVCVGRRFGERLEHGAVALLEVFELISDIRRKFEVPVGHVLVLAALGIVDDAVQQHEQASDGQDGHVGLAVERRTGADWRVGREQGKRSLGPAEGCARQAGPEVARERPALAWLVAWRAAASKVEEIVDGEEGFGIVRLVGLHERGGAADWGGREVQEQVGHFCGRAEGCCMCALH